MKIFVTGATGFLGKYILEELAASGYEVVAFGRNATVGKQLISEKVTFIQGDFTNLSEIRAAAKGVDGIVHAGALSTVWGKWTDFYQINVVGTENILKVCEENQVKRLVFISSPSIYAGPKHQFDIREEEAPEKNELNNYIKSKLLAEAKIREKSQLNSVIIRPRGLFGIGDTSIIPRLLKVNKKIGMPLFDGGEQLVDVTCVENVAFAIRLGLESPQAVGNTYNITNGEPRPFKQILDQMLAEIGTPARYIRLNYSFMLLVASSLEASYDFFNSGKEPIFTKYTLFLLKYSQTLSIEKAKNELGYYPKLSLDEGIKKYAEDYRKN
ncbi:NAD-dependent epimerase/dehydratase family protein [Carnobacterium gallinarum]|uniref:NAD-dependent epimerase/dehydratase family protein n=1 Tax=Carnobacterium gallinarum TaxID=2749 RepID=UPI00055125C6|nr:NAD(P)-dependent oxidoreductase [Carnobacterium gallinarum]